MGQYKFILSGGGTGGHIYPAIAIAYELNFAFLIVLFCRCQDKMEKNTASRFQIRGLWIAGLQRKISLQI
jgi:UDP-N-acetylglucosamine--N-acetylmuramyl-(pentapeptide) pyrophosphoryl-undecaprenol N-acetylglucosamine transferase